MNPRPQPAAFGLEPRHWAIVQKLAIHPLHEQGCQVWVFGSRARGDHQPFSDLDLLVTGQPQPRLLSRIQETLEESSLPVRVDLVREDELAESYRPSVFKDRVEVK